MPSKTTYLRTYQRGVVDNPPNPVSYEDYSTLHVLESSRSDGVKLPHWRTRIRNKSSATTALSGTRESLSWQSGSSGWSYKNLSTGRIAVHSYSGLQLAVPWLPPLNGSSTEAENQAVRRLYQAIQSTNSEFSGLVAAGELRETGRLIHQASTLIANGIPRYLAQQRRNIARVLGYHLYDPVTRQPSSMGRARWRAKPPSKRQRKALQQQLSDTWLTYAFGVRPLLNDVADATSAYYRWATEPPQLHRKLRGYGVSESNVTVSAAESPLYGGTFYVNKKRLDRIEVIYRAGYFGIGERPAGQDDLTRLGELCGFGWRDFVPSVWNLLPWSFFVDYFVNVGEVLTALFTATGNVTWCQRTVVRTREERAQGRLKPMTEPNMLYSFGDPGSYVRSTTTFSRDVSAVPFPGLQVRIPGSGGTWTNILALLGGRSNNHRN